MTSALPVQARTAGGTPKQRASWCASLALDLTTRPKLLNALLLFWLLGAVIFQHFVVAVVSAQALKRGNVINSWFHAQVYVPAFLVGLVNLAMWAMLLLPMSMSRWLTNRLVSSPLAQWLPLEHMVEYHRHIGMAFIVETVIIAAGFGIYFAVACTAFRNHDPDIGSDYCNGSSGPAQASGEYWSSEITVTGFAMTALALIIAVPAMRCVRRRISFELFMGMHAVFVPFYILSIIHTIDAKTRANGFSFREQILWWVLLPVVVYPLDVLLRGLYSKEMRVLSVKVIGSGAGRSIMLRLQKPAGWAYRAGQHARINVPGLRDGEWHPFTIASSATSAEVEFAIRVVPSPKGRFGARVLFCCGDARTWTERAFDYFVASMLPGDASGGVMRAVSVRVEGPFGSVLQGVFALPQVAIVASGTGAVSAFAAIRELYAADKVTTHVVHERGGRGSSAATSVADAAVSPLLDGSRTSYADALDGTAGVHLKTVLVPGQNLDSTARARRHRQNRQLSFFRSGALPPQLRSKTTGVHVADLDVPPPSQADGNASSSSPSAVAARLHQAMVRMVDMRRQISQYWRAATAWPWFYGLSLLVANFNVVAVGLDVSWFALGLGRSLQPGSRWSYLALDVVSVVAIGAFLAVIAMQAYIGRQVAGGTSAGGGAYALAGASIPPELLHLLVAGSQLLLLENYFGVPRSGLFISLQVMLRVYSILVLYGTNALFSAGGAAAAADGAGYMQGMHFVWVNRDAADFLALGEELRDTVDALAATCGPGYVTVRCFLTGKPDMDTRLALEGLFAGSPVMHGCVTYGRPDMAEVVAGLCERVAPSLPIPGANGAALSHQQQQQERDAACLNVLFCGGPALAASLREAVLAARARLGRKLVLAFGAETVFG